MSADPTFGSRAFHVKRILWSVVVAAVAGLLFAPVARWGQCPANGDCVITVRAITGLPTAGYVWIIAAILAATITWTIYTKRHS